MRHPLIISSDGKAQNKTAQIIGNYKVVSTRRNPDNPGMYDVVVTFVSLPINYVVIDLVI